MNRIVKVSAFLMIASLSCVKCSNYTLIGIQEVKQEIRNLKNDMDAEKIKAEDKLATVKQEILDLIIGIESKEAGLSLSKDDEAKLKFLLKQVISYK